MGRGLTDDSLAAHALLPFLFGSLPHHLTAPHFYKPCDFTATPRRPPPLPCSGPPRRPLRAPGMDTVPCSIWNLKINLNLLFTYGGFRCCRAKQLMMEANVLPSSWEDLPPDLLGLVLRRLPSVRSAAPGATAPNSGGTCCPRRSRGSPSATAEWSISTALQSTLRRSSVKASISATSPSTTWSSSCTKMAAAR
jgi:hypothetical protein